MSLFVFAKLILPYLHDLPVDDPGRKTVLSKAHRLATTNHWVTVGLVTFHFQMA